MNPHKHWVKRPISDLRRYIAKIIKKTTRTTREQLKKVSLANMLNCFLYHFGRFAKIPKLNCPKLSRLSLYIKAMLLALKVMLLEIEVMLLAAEVMLLQRVYKIDNVGDDYASAKTLPSLRVTWSLVYSQWKSFFRRSR